MTTHGQIDAVGVVNGAVGLTLLVLPLVGMSYVLARLAFRLWAKAPEWWRSRPIATATAGLAAATAVALQIAVEWPDTFASALEHAQVAQAIEEARTEGRPDELATTPAADPRPMPTEPTASTGSTATTTTSAPADPAAAYTGTGGLDDGTGQATAGTADGMPEGGGDGGVSGVADAGPTSTAGGAAATSPTTSPSSLGAVDAPPGQGPTSGGSAGRPAPTIGPTTATTTTSPPTAGGLLQAIIDLIF